jgi:hypothetical protein
LLIQKRIPRRDGFRVSKSSELDPERWAKLINHRSTGEGGGKVIEYLQRTTIGGPVVREYPKINNNRSLRRRKVQPQIEDIWVNETEVDIWELKYYWEKNSQE